MLSGSARRIKLTSSAVAIFSLTLTGKNYSNPNFLFSAI
jgi:hypothetical protein